MRRRFQNGNLFKRGKKWVAQWWEDGHRRKRTLGLISKITKTDAQAELSGILAVLASRAGSFITGQTFIVDGGQSVG